MEQLHDGVEVPESTLLQREQVNRYGSVPNGTTARLHRLDGECSREIQMTN